MVDNPSKDRRAQHSIPPAQYRLQVPKIVELVRHLAPDSIAGQVGALQQAAYQHYKKVHYDVMSDVMVLKVNSRANTFVRVTQKQFNMDM